MKETAITDLFAQASGKPKKLYFLKYCIKLLKTVHGRWRTVFQAYRELFGFAVFNKKRECI